jgi:GNAT superfamily N-acetyltransferase
MTEYQITSWSSEMVRSRIEQLAQVYAEVYAEPPYDAGDLWDVQTFLKRTHRQTERDGFSFVGSEAEGHLAGFSFGLTFGEGVWWSGDATEPPADLRAASKFAVIELVVRRQFRGRGIGRQLISDLLAGRPEQYAILTAMPNATAREIYRRWGWVQTGTAQHTPQSPILDALALALPGGDGDAIRSYLR